jgi:hypothetical protein
MNGTNPTNWTNNTTNGTTNSTTNMTNNTTNTSVSNTTTNTTITNYTIMFKVMDDMQTPVSGITAVVNQKTTSNNLLTIIPVVNGSFAVFTLLTQIFIQLKYKDYVIFNATFQSNVTS